MLADSCDPTGVTKAAQEAALADACVTAEAAAATCVKAHTTHSLPPIDSVGAAMRPLRLRQHAWCTAAATTDQLLALSLPDTLSCADTNAHTLWSLSLC